MKTKPYNKADYTVPEFSSFPDFLEGIGTLYAQKPALSWFTRRGEEQTLTYGELTARVARLRTYLLGLELPAQSHIALIGENCADWVLAYLAIVSAGHIAVCVDTEQSDEQIRSMVLRSDSCLCILSPSFVPICRPLLESGAISALVQMNGRPTDPALPVLETLYSPACTPSPTVPAAPEQTAALVFTSGTTSLSKMVLLSHRAIMANTFASGAYVCFFDRVFCSLPFYHTYGFNCGVLNSFLRGCHLYINGDLKTTMRDMQLARPDTLLAVPLMVEAIHNQLWLGAEKAGKAASLRKLLSAVRMGKKLGLSLRLSALTALRQQISPSLRLIICGGAHLGREIAEEFELLGIQVLQGYGITECSPLISVNCNYANKLGSVGLPLPGTQVKIVDGEVWVRGPSVMQGYYLAPEETAAVLTEDGWFQTGDLGELDKDGFLSLTGRKKNLIVFKNGKKVSPETLEERLSAIPMVREVLVTGTANGVFADDVKLTASIYPDPQRTQGLTSYEILEQLQREVDKINNALPTYQQIQLVNIREKEFSKTGTRKIKRCDS